MCWRVDIYAVSMTVKEDFKEKVNARIAYQELFFFSHAADDYRVDAIQ